ncbi:MAG TPA: ABC transporter ATP-binding protein [Thermoleophilaceae bacterium]|jgi:ABC-2 type transport system ATP-binding protein
MLEVRDVKKSYGEVVALDGVNLEIAPGEVLGLLGPNGAGKTTLVSIVAGLRAPDGGSVRVGGVDVADDPEAVRRSIGIAPQELGVYLQLSVRKNLAYFGKLAGLGRSEIGPRVEEIGAALDLVDLFDRRVQELSGGEQRRVHTAMALIHRAPLLLLDEPTAGVDVHTRNALLELVKRLASEGAAVCYATHYLPEVETLGASVAILDGGRIIAGGNVHAMIEEHAGTVLEIRVTGAVPAELAALGEVDQDVVRIPTRDPSATLQDALAKLDGGTERIDGIDFVHPSLETVYLSLTGRKFEAGEPEEAAA